MVSVLKKFGISMIALLMACSLMTFVATNAEEENKLINTSANTNIRVVDYSSQCISGGDPDEAGEAINVLDYNGNTYWHSDWKYSKRMPQYLTFDLGKIYELSEVSYLPRQDGTWINGDIFAARVYVGTTQENMKLVGTYRFSENGNLLANRDQFKVMEVNTIGRFVKVEAFETGGDSGHDIFASMGEIRFYGTEYVEPAVVDKSALQGEFLDSVDKYMEPNKYTEDTYNAFKVVYETAKALLLNNNATQLDVDATLSTLIEVKSALVEKTRELENLINTSANTDITVCEIDSQSSDDLGSNTLDYNNGSIWHSDWSGSHKLPLSITYDLAAIYNLTDLEFLPRQDNSNNGDIFEFNLFVGNEVDKLVSVGHFTFETTGSGTSEQLTNRAQFKRAMFEATGRYVKITVTRGGSNNGQKQNFFASMAEIRFYGKQPSEEDGFISDVDKTALGELIRCADDIIGTENPSGQYTTSSFSAYQVAYENALDVYEDDTVAEDTVVVIYNALNVAIENLVNVEVLKSNIAIETENLANEVDQSDVWKLAYQLMISEATTVLNKEDVTQDEIDQANDRLSAVEIYANLCDLINQAENTDTLGKTDDSIQAFTQALNEAKEVVNNSDASYDDLESSYEGLLTSIENLADILCEDKNALIAALDAARSAYETNNTNGIYTKTSFNILKEAYEVANELNNNPTAGLLAVEKATKVLVDAFNSLVITNQYVSKDDITIVNVGNQQANEPLSNVFDGNQNTLWHTNWNGSDRSTHHFTIKVPLNYYDQIELLPRPQRGVDGDQNGLIKEVKVYVKCGENGTWVLAAHQSGLGENGNNWDVVDLGEVKADYIKVEVVNADSSNNKKFASLGELKIHSSTPQLDHVNWKAVAYFSNGKIAEYKDNVVAYEMAQSGLDPKEGPAEYMLDGNTYTHYHTDYDFKAKDYYRNPITIILKMGSNQTFNYIDWLNRTDNTDCRLSQFDVYTIDTNKEYTDDELESGAPWVQKFAITAENQANNRFYLGEQTTKYVKIVATSSDSGYHLTCSELDFYHYEDEEEGEIRYSGMNTTLDAKQWIKESAYNQNKEVKGYYGIVDGITNKFSNSEANIVRYITSSVLSVKAQSQIVGDVINVRFLTSIASTNLEALRFKIEILNSDGTVNKTGFVNTNRVFGSVVADNVEISNAADVFGNHVSTHFAVAKLNNIPVSLKDAAQQTKIRVTPYWAPEDVTEDDNDNYVEGISRTFTVKELYDNASNTNTMNE